MIESIYSFFSMIANLFSTLSTYLQMIFGMID